MQQQLFPGVSENNCSEKYEKLTGKHRSRRFESFKKRLTILTWKNYILLNLV